MKIKKNKINIFIDKKNKEFLKNENNYLEDKQVEFQKNFLLWLVKTLIGIVRQKR